MVLILWGWLLAIIVLRMSILRHYEVSIGVSLGVGLLSCDGESAVSERERGRGSWEADGLENIDSRALGDGGVAMGEAMDWNNVRICIFAVVTQALLSWSRSGRCGTRGGREKRSGGLGGGVSEMTREAQLCPGQRYSTRTQAKRQQQGMYLQSAGRG